MGNLVSFDLDKIKAIVDEAPSLLSMAEAAGWAGAAKVTPYAPMAAPLIGLLAKLAGGDTAGLTGPGVPDTGPKGKGRMSYMRNRQQYTDSAVVKACEQVTMSGLPAGKTIADTINFTLACMYPSVPKNKWDDAQTRSAIDKILDDDGLSEGVCDKLGDMILFALNNMSAK